MSPILILFWIWNGISYVLISIKCYFYADKLPLCFTVCDNLLIPHSTGEWGNILVPGPRNWYNSSSISFSCQLILKNMTLLSLVLSLLLTSLFWGICFVFYSILHLYTLLHVKTQKFSGRMPYRLIHFSVINWKADGLQYSWVAAKHSS